MQPFNGDVYVLGLLYDERLPLQHWMSRQHIVLSCHVGITAASEVVLLKERTQRADVITTQRGRKRERLTRTTHHWAIPAWLPFLMADNPRQRTPQVWIADTFKTVMVTHHKAMQRFIVRVRQGGCVAAFGIELARAKVFFRDRDKTDVAVDGKRKRIFHSVREHTRVLPTARTTDVRAHYRGIRSFAWGAYGVHIVLPQHAPVLDIDLPTRYVSDVPEADRAAYVDEGVMGAQVAQVLDR